MRRDRDGAGDDLTPRSHKRVLLLAVAAFLCASASLAIGILLFGDFGRTEGSILATTALLAAHGLLALPAAIVLDQGRLPGLAAVVLVLAAAGASLSIGATWTDEPPDSIGNAIGTITAFLLASTQATALSARSRAQDPRSVRRLFALSTGLAVVVAAMFTTLLWAEIDSEGYARVIASLVVLDALAVALQPILARARQSRTVHRLRVLAESGETVALAVEGADLGAAAAKAIRMLEHEGRRVRSVDVVGSEEAHSAENPQPHSARPRMVSRRPTGRLLA